MRESYGGCTGPGRAAQARPGRSARGTFRPFVTGSSVTAMSLGRPTLEHLPHPHRSMERKMTRKILLVTALVAGVAATANAQICSGTAPFSAGRTRVGIGAEFPDGAKTYGAGLTWAHNSGLY